MDRHLEKVLITGITGSGGSYLAEYIVSHYPDVKVHGISRWHSTGSSRNIRGISDKISVHECDLNDFGSVLTLLTKIRPDAIFHLAAHANVRTSFITPVAVLNNNIVGTVNLFESIRLASIDPIVQLCSTSEVYGQVDPENVPIKETCPLNPSSPYAVSKVAQDLLGFTYFRSYNLKIIRTRMFAYLNPRRSDLFATAFARQIARIEAGLQKTLYHGNLDSVRTLIDVRDAMASYWIATQQGEFGDVYNIGGATTIRVGEFLERLKKCATVPIPTQLDEELLRPADVTLQIPDVTKFFKLTGWKPKYTLEESIAYLLDYCRSELQLEMREGIAK